MNLLKVKLFASEWKISLEILNRFVYEVLSLLAITMKTKSSVFPLIHFWILWICSQDDTS